MNTHSATLDRYAVRYIEADGTNTQGPDCKNWGCAVLTIFALDNRPLDAIVINGTPHLLREPVPAMAYLLQHRAVAEGMVAAIDARAASEPLLNRAPAEGWVVVPREPTEEMVIAGFESRPDEHFSSPEEWEAHQALSGCRQAAREARLCYAAMLAAAPIAVEPSLHAEQAYIEGALEWLARECDSPEGLGSEAIAKRIRAILAEQRRPAPAAPAVEVDEVTAYDFDDELTADALREFGIKAPSVAEVILLQTRMAEALTAALSREGGGNG